ncbi:MAG: TraR/DksA family transcriptional regulator [Betaproteobacteria bacterium]|nr:MAG: TraR/DksA family transcriptional regulator [Betaproteobacteria bacterium]
MTLTAQQLEELRRAIETRHAALLEEIRGDVGRARDESYGELAGPVTDPADEASADLIADVDQAEVTRDLGEARALEAAQARLAKGGYGLCTDCGSEIAFERLRVNPVATRCVDCQRVHEKTYAHPAEPRL